MIMHKFYTLTEISPHFESESPNSHLTHESKMMTRAFTLPATKYVIIKTNHYSYLYDKFPLGKAFWHENSETVNGKSQRGEEVSPMSQSVWRRQQYHHYIRPGIKDYCRILSKFEDLFQCSWRRKLWNCEKMLWNVLPNYGEWIGYKAHLMKGHPFTIHGIDTHRFIVE